MIHVKTAHPNKKSIMPHMWVKHINCQDPYCMICEGGLADCKLCGCFEGSLPTDCPGVKSFKQYVDAIYAGEIDYVNGAWVKEVSINSPAFYRMEEHEID
jgi:hypothetical protein